MSATAAQPATAPTGGGSALSRRRAIAVWSLVVLAALVLLVSSLTVWVKRQALDTDAWTNASGRLLEDPEVQDALSIYLVNTLYDNVDVAESIRRALPPERAGLAPIIAGGLQQVAVTAARRLFASPRFQALWEEANRRAHENLLAVLEGEDVRRFQTADGTVVLDLSGLVQRFADRLGLSERLPEDAGKITILKSDQLDTAQKTVKAIKAGSVLLVLVVLALFGLAIYLARGRRRTVLRASAASLIVVGLLVLIVRRTGGDWVVGSLVEVDAFRPAGEATWGIATELLRDIGFALIAYGIVGVVCAWLAGPTRLAVGIRRRVAPTFREQPAIVFGGVVVAYLLLILWGPTPASRQLLGIVVFGLILLFGVEMLRRQTLEEFEPVPAVATAPGTGAVHPGEPRPG
jgi:hypothetical protein